MKTSPLLSLRTRRTFVFSESVPKKILASSLLSIFVCLFSPWMWSFMVASISSVRFQINDKESQNDLKMTMPGRLKIQKFLRKAVNAGCKYAVLEITSEGIKQSRHKFINFNTLNRTNTNCFFSTLYLFNFSNFCL